MNFELRDLHRDAVTRVDHPLRLNASACLLQLKRYSEAEEMVSEILSKDKSQMKARYHRCQARLGRDDLEPGNQTALELLDSILVIKRKYLSDVRKVWQGKLAKASLSGGDAITAYANASQALQDVTNFDATVQEREKDLASKCRPSLPSVDADQPSLTSVPIVHSKQDSKFYEPKVTYVPFSSIVSFAIVLQHSSLLTQLQVSQWCTGNIRNDCNVCTWLVIAPISLTRATSHIHMHTHVAIHRLQKSLLAPTKSLFWSFIYMCIVHDPSRDCYIRYFL